MPKVKGLKVESRETGGRPLPLVIGHLLNPELRTGNGYETDC